MINWSLLNTPDIAGALQSGMKSGQAMAKQRAVDGALSTLAQQPDDAQAMGVLRVASPELAFKLEDRQREAETRGILGRVFDGYGGPGGFNQRAPQPQTRGAFPRPSIGTTPQDGGAGALARGGAVLPVQSALSGPGAAQSILPPQGALGQFDGRGAAPQPPAVPASAAPAPVPADPSPTGLPAQMVPASLLDPADLPPRTDGMRLNPDAMRELYRKDPASAFKVQEMVFNADAAAFKRMQASGGVLASAARHLGRMVNPDGTPNMEGRQAELQAMMPQLQALGVTSEMVGKVDLTDVGLSRYLDLGRNLNTLVDDDRADRRLNADIEDDDADNARADRNTSSVIEDRGARRGLIARGQNMTDARGRFGIQVSSGDRRRGQDIGADTARRGQDITDKRVRETGGRRVGRGAAPKNPDSMIPGTAALPVTVTTVTQAKMLSPGTFFRTPQGKVMRVPQ